MTKQNTKHTPYVYKIVWSSTKTWYVGVQFGKRCTPEDLWVAYFTSSKHVKQYRHLHGEPDIIEILQTFETGEAARSFEQQILTAASAAQDPLSLNRHNGGGEKFYSGEHTAATKAKMRTAKLGKKGKPHTAASKEKLRQGALGKTKSAAHKEKLRIAATGKTRSAAAKAKMVDAKIAIRAEKIASGLASKYQIKQHLKYLAKRGEPFEPFEPFEPAATSLT